MGVAGTLSAADEIISLVKALGNGDYPGFVAGKRMEDKVPVFYFHRVDSGSFQKQLEYLKNNGYKSISLKEFEDAYTRNGGAAGKKVLLTFDDGYEDLYTTAYPLLASRGFRAVAFVSPFWLDRPGYLTWKQAAEMDSSGIIDIQSHSYSHATIPVSPKVIGFFHPGISPTELKDMPILERKSGLPILPHPPWGSPIYEYHSGLEDSRRYLGNEELERGCIEFVSDHGGIQFFEQKGWEKRLRERAKSIQDASRESPVFESEAGQRKRISFEVTAALKELSSRLKGKEVTAMAFPRHAAGDCLLTAVKDSGIRLIFGGILPLDSHRLSAGVRYITRVNADFIPRLPGRRRQSLFRILAKKLSLRLAGSKRD